MNTIKHLDGNLDNLLIQFCVIRGLQDNPVLNVDNLQAFPLAQIIVNGRADGLHWCFKEVFHTNEADDFSNLFPTDIAALLPIDTNNALPDYLEKEGITLDGIDWDTESSAWYPRFDTEENAKAAIFKLDELFDRLFLGKLKQYLKDCVGI